jgi:hypothetical protein
VRLGAPKRMRVGVRAGSLCAIATVAVCIALSTGAQAATVASIAPSFAPDRLSAGTAFTLTIAYSDPQGGIPEPVSHAVVHLPAGLGINLRGVGTCPKALLEKQAGRGCPASARVGSGSSLAGAHLGAINLNETAALTAWRGPNQGGRPTLEILGQGLTPLEERVVVIGVLKPDHAPYGQQLVMTVPPIPTLPTEPNASILHFSLTVGSAHGGHRGGLIRVPRSCPAGGFPFGADFAYAGGSTSTSTARVRCP